MLGKRANESDPSDYASQQEPALQKQRSLSTVGEEDEGGRGGGSSNSPNVKLANKLIEAGRSGQTRQEKVRVSDLTLF